MKFIRDFEAAAGSILIFLLMAACQFSNQKSPEKTALPLFSAIPSIPATSSSTTAYQMPPMPLVFTTREQQADFLMANYWNNFNFKDTALLQNGKRNEKAFADFVNILRQVAPEKAGNGIKVLMIRAGESQRMYLHIFGFAEKYLYNPNSPFRNEMLYEFFLKDALTTKAIDPLHKIRIQKQFEMAQRNRPGKKANNFNFTLKEGTSSNLFQVKSKFLLLYFQNPDCDECKITRGKIVKSNIISQLTGNGRLKILAIYPDQDLALWNRHYSEYPISWINGYDKGSLVMRNQLYDLKAIPTLYLLDENKIVLLRDPTFEEIEEYLLSLK